MSAALMSKAVRQYLERHAEPEAALADQLGAFGHAVVLPAYGEGDDLVQALRSIPAGSLGEVVVVLVVNGRSNSPAWVHDRNHEVQARLRDAFGEDDETIFDDPPARLVRFPRGRILLVDRASPSHRLPDDQGVGLARKLGADICLRLHAAGRLASPFIHSTDADVELPPDYFERQELAQSSPPAAVVYPFVHRPEDDTALAEAIALYEISLRYYVLGLAYAGSPYAYHTIGSTLAVDAAAYAMVRGFPKRTAGEDFYLLSKLAKVGSVARLSGSPIVVRGRPSDRVPFGTGPAVRRIADLGPEAFKLYDPSLFEYLKAWLLALSAISPGKGDATDLLARETCQRLGLESARLIAAVEASGAIDAVVRAASESKDDDGLRRRLSTWFDAFRTLKLLHALQAAGLPKVPWHEALRRAPFAARALPQGPAPSDAASLRLVASRLASFESQ
jgi:hypothetical protein